MSTISSTPTRAAQKRRGEFFYEDVRDALKQCAVLADEKFKAEAARIGAILRAKPLAWKRRKGVIHYTSLLDKALAAHYGAVRARGRRAEKVPLQLLQRLQAEVAIKGYTLVYTGLAETSLQRLLLFPLNEPLAAIAACGTNAANYGQQHARCCELVCRDPSRAPVNRDRRGVRFHGSGFCPADPR